MRRRMAFSRRKYLNTSNIPVELMHVSLCTAIRDNREKLVELLLANGANPNLQASEFPAFKCITHHRAHILPRLIAAGADLNSPKGIVEKAVEHNETEALAVLLDHDVDVNARSPEGHTALTTAIKAGRIELIDTLLAHGCDPSVRGQEWPIGLAVKTPMILAKLLPHIALARIIPGALEMAVVADQLESVSLKSMIEADPNMKMEG
jgi:ankyrin repeat protein